MSHAQRRMVEMKAECSAQVHELTTKLTQVTEEAHATKTALTRQLQDANEQLAQAKAAAKSNGESYERVSADLRAKQEMYLQSSTSLETALKQRSADLSEAKAACLQQQQLLQTYDRMHFGSVFYLGFVSLPYLCYAALKQQCKPSRLSTRL